MLAHGIITAIVGYSVFRAGLDENARALGGTGTALHTLRHFGPGPVIFGLVAAGLVAYGLSLLVLAAHARRRSR
jgi:ABC-type transporter Mla maintaining outer membrane lipid asymmetry permease subunit MlaE